MENERVDIIRRLAMAGIGAIYDEVKKIEEEVKKNINLHGTVISAIGFLAAATIETDAECTNEPIERHLKNFIMTLCVNTPLTKLNKGDSNATQEETGSATKETESQTDKN